MSVHPAALRERVVRAVETERASVEEVADLFEVGRLSVLHWLQLKREIGTVEPRPRGGGNVSTVDLHAVQKLVEAKPERTSFDITAAYNKLIPRHRHVHRSSIQRVFDRCGYVIKKNVRVRRNKIDPISRKSDNDSRGG